MVMGNVHMASNMLKTARQTCLLLIAASTLACAGAARYPQLKWPYCPGSSLTSSSSTVMEKRLGWQVCESNINAGPQWHDPGTTPPPLAVQDAITISYSELSDYFPEVELWDLQDIWLNSFGPGKWFYVVSWKARGTVVENDLEIPVLMDGRAVKLVTE